MTIKKLFCLFVCAFLICFYKAECQTLITQLEEYYTFDETTGNVFNSVNSAVNPSSTVNATYGVAGKINTAFGYNGSSSMVTFADHANWTISATGTISISVWIYLTGENIAANGYGTIWGHQAGPQLYLKYISAGSYRLGWYTGNTEAITTALSFSLNTWYHIVMLKNSSSLTFYRNGTSVGTLTASDNTIDPPTVYIGSNTHTTPEAFNGRIDELGIWKRVLTSTEVTQLYNSGAGLAYPFGTTTSYSLTTSASPAAGGSIGLSPTGGSYASGTTVTAAATPNSGYTFSGWSGALTGTTNPGTVTMNSNNTLTATFTPVPGGADNLGNHTATQNIKMGNYWLSGDGGNEGIRVASNGYIGIFTANPTQPLTVNGKILATEVEVVSSIASDYVFEPEYELMPLTELELYLRENKHLPGIPSAAEFSEKGQNLAETDDLLLKKIEELTLYILKQEKAINEQNQKILGLQTEVDALKSLIK